MAIYSNNVDVFQQKGGMDNRYSTCKTNVSTVVNNHVGGRSINTDILCNVEENK